MLCARILIHGPTIRAKSNVAGDRRKQRRNIVCCCPRSGSQSGISESTQNKHLRLPPGPSMLHMMGLLHYVIRSFPYHHPLRDLANAYGPLVHVKLGEVSTIVVSSAELAKEVLKTRDPACADRPKSVATQIISYDYTGVVLTPYDEYWRQMRSFCISKFMCPKNVRALEYIREEEGLVLTDSIRLNYGVPFDLTEKIFLYVNSTACRAAFGDASIDKDVVVSAIQEGVSLGANFALADVFPSIKGLELVSWNKYRMSKLREKVDEVLGKIIDDHRKNMIGRSYDEELGKEDFVDVLLRLKESDEFSPSLTDDNIKSVISDIVGAITETTSSLVDWAMAELMRNPYAMTKAQDELRQAFKGRRTIQEGELQQLKYLKLIIKETLRLHPPTAIVTRSCREEIEIDGYDIPLHSNVIVNIWAIGRDPKYWDNPESFVPERFEANPIDFMGTHFEYIPFGAGKRICPGMAFGLVNAEALLAKLLYHFDWKLPLGTSSDGVDMTETSGMAVSRKNGLYLLATPYDP